MKSSRLFIAAGAVASLVALSACGSSGGDAASSASTPTATQTVTPAAAQDIVAVAAATPDLSTLVSAVQAADLGTTLQSTGPFTVFAPNNAAFAKLPTEVVTKLLLPCNKAALTTILTYHVVPGKVTAADIKPGEVATAEGSTVTLAVSGSTVKVNDATVVMADVPASNGVVHVIDSVLVPKDVDVATLKSSC